MGVKFTDFWTIMHFLFGVITTMALVPSKPMLSLVLGNVLHGSMEFTERDYDQNGKVLESRVNHVGDVLAFALGSIVGLWFTDYTVQNPTLRYILLAVIIIAFVQEVSRELWPDTWPLDGAHNPFDWGV